FMTENRKREVYTKKTNISTPLVALTLQVTMGAASSKQSGPKPRKLTKEERTAAQLQSLIPVDPVPYRGPQLQYCLIDVPVKMKAHMQFGFGGQQLTSDIDQYYATIVQPYNDGYVMTQFMKIPGQMNRGGMISMSVTFPYQAIHTRPINVAPSPERWQLRVEKSVIELQVFRYGLISGGGSSAANTSHIHDKIHEMTQAGGRLICVEMTGAQQGPNMSQAMSGYGGAFGVDMMFNMPLHPNPKLYSYQAANVPVPYTVQAGFSMPSFQCNIDWNAQFGSWLNQGWKLIEIFLDNSQSQQRTGLMSAGGTLNSIWWFEKENSRLNDTTPLYQGAIIPYAHEISAGFGSVNAKSSWTPIIQEMGNKGWELATILPTPTMSRNGMTSFSMHLLMFFQRPIIYEAQGYTAPPAEAMSAPPPPSYNAVVDQKPTNTAEKSESSGVLR
ncbi:unnamed protein product, partial [Owenia fusiformis]